MFVSVDSVDPAELVRRTYDVPFPIWSDPDVRLHEAFRVVNQLDAAGVDRLHGFGLPIERFSRRDHHKIAIPSMFLIDAAGTVRWAHAAHDYKTRPPVGAVLAALDRVLGAR